MGSIRAYEVHIERWVTCRKMRAFAEWLVGVLNRVCKRTDELGSAYLPWQQTADCQLRYVSLAVRREKIVVR